jgi:hypothetical protein
MSFVLTRSAEDLRFELGLVLASLLNGIST